MRARRSMIACAVRARESEGEGEWVSNASVSVVMGVCVPPSGEGCAGVMGVVVSVSTGTLRVCVCVPCFSTGGLSGERGAVFGV